VWVALGRRRSKRLSQTAARRLIDSSTHRRIGSLAHRFIVASIHWRIDSLAHRFHWRVGASIHWLLINSSAHQLID
jgi:hypothetical protein